MSNYDKILRYCNYFERSASKKDDKKDKCKGRSEKSMKKQYKTMTKGEDHPFAHMVEKFKKHPDKIKDPEGLAARLKDLGKGTTKWREGPSK